MKRVFSLGTLAAIGLACFAAAANAQDDQRTDDEALAALGEWLLAQSPDDAESNPPLDGPPVMLAQREPADPPPPPRRNAPPRDQQQPAPDDPFANVDFSELNLSGGDLEVQVVGNQVIIRGSESDVDMVEALIRTVDRETGRLELRVVTVTERDANDVAQRVQQALEAAKPFASPESRPKLTPVASNIIIVAALPEEIDNIVQIIHEVDAIPPMFPKIEQLTFTIQNRRASEVATQLRDFLEQLQASAGMRAEDSKVQVIANNANNTIIVTAQESDRERIQSFIDSIDVAPDPEWGEVRLTVFPLIKTEAQALADVINELLATEEQRDAAEEVLFRRLMVSKAQPDGTITDLPPIDLEKPIQITPDEKTNSLIVATSGSNIEAMQELISLLDGVPIEEAMGLRLFPLQFSDAARLVEVINEMFDKGKTLPEEADGSGQGAVPQGRIGGSLVYNVSVQADERTNTLIVAGRQDQILLVTELVGELDIPTRTLVEATRLFELKFADAQGMKNKLDELYDGIESSAGGEVVQAPTIIADKRINSLLIAGTRDVISHVEGMIARLDVKTGPMTAQFAIYPLKHNAARNVAPKMQELFDQRSQSEQGDQTPAVIMSDDPSNSLVVLASRDDHDVILELKDMLDRPSGLSGMIEIFPLQYARAEGMAERIEQLFGGEAGDERADAIAIEADERSNSLVVWASASQMQNIREMVEKLDRVRPAKNMRMTIIPLQQAKAEDFKTLLDETFLSTEGAADDEAVIVSFTDQDEFGRDVVKNLLRQDIKITADPRTNSLMVMAPNESIDMLEAMIREFDRVRPVKSEIRLYPLVNSNAVSMVEQLADLFEAEAGGDGEVQSQLAFGGLLGDDDVASVGQRLRFVADERTNTVLAAGAEVDLRMIEELIRFIDSQDVEERVVEVYKTKFREATELATAVRNFIEQEQQPLANIDDQTSQMKLAERQVSIEAIGEAEEGSSSLLIGVSPQYYNQTMQMLTQLDRPEQQVKINVLVAEVSLQDDVELGMEFAASDLNFSENAVLGPNGIIQGSNFDHIAGTDLGAAGLGLGGFSFTVTGEDFNFLFHALQTNSRVEVLSRPSLTVQNGQEGNITIADSVPFVQSAINTDTGSTNSAVEYRDVGITLTATPTISPDGYVTIQLEQTIDNFSGENIQLSEGLVSPIFQNRQVTTNVTVRDGETVILGGLITTRNSEGENKVPILGDLPGIGPLFRFTQVGHQKTELLVVLTVDILRDDEDFQHSWDKELGNYFNATRAIQKAPHMSSGLRIRADDVLGPASDTPAAPEPQAQPKPRFGPQPKTYGPVISDPGSASTSNVPVHQERPVPRFDPIPMYALPASESSASNGATAN